MDSYQQQQHHRYMRPPPPQPPPSTADPYHQQQQQPPPPPRPPVHPQGTWYPTNQFQYHPAHSPSPPPQWAPPPPPPPPAHSHSDHFPPPPPPGSYPPPQHHYPAHHQFPSPSPPPPPPPPRPQVASHFPPRPPHSQISSSYTQPNQEWGTPNWGHHQGWDYPVAHSNEEDWAARARAWADAKTAMENQHQQSQFTPVGRPEEQGHYHDQYPQSVEPHYGEIQHQSIPASNYQQVPVSAAPHRPPVVHPSEVPSVSSDSSYVPEGHLHTVRDGTPAADSNAMFQHQGNLPISPSVHQQEVPSSYSSVTGNNGSMPFSNTSYEGQHHMQPPQAMPLADQPLEFTPRFNRDDPHMQPSYAYLDSVGPVRGMDTVTTMPSMNSWTAPVAHGVGYPPIAPVLPSGPQQHDPSLAVPSPVPGHTAPPFSSFPVSGLQPTIPIAAPPFSLSAGTALHPTAAFPGDAYGVPSVSERPKKASVPNWLKEEIKKAVITSSSLDHPKEESQSIEDEGYDKSVGKGEQADSKSIDSSRSTEEDEDDEDYVEAARTVAINQEIKRVLTEVLLKVTDELFDEIATKVLNEDLRIEVDKDTVTSNHRVSPSPSTLPPGKATAKIIVPGVSKESEVETVVEKSSSSFPGDVLGLANYATDDDDGDEIQSFSSPNSRKKELIQHLSFEKPLEDKHGVDANGSSSVQPEELSKKNKIMETEPSEASIIQSKYTDTEATMDFSSDENRKNESSAGGSKPDSSSVSRSKDTGDIVRSDPPEDDDNTLKTSKDSNQVKEMRMKQEKNDRHDGKRSSGKDLEKKEESGMRTDEKGNENHRRHDERHPRKEKTDERNGSKERMKEQSAKLLAQDSESKKRSSHVDAKEDRKETERQHKAGAKEESNRKREHTKDKESGRSRHKHASDSSRHKRRRSSSISRGRSSKDSSVHHDNDSSDDASNDSQRKLHSRRRNLSPSPSPGKSRRRQVSRSPHSKHSQRRHSPFSSFDTNRPSASSVRIVAWLIDFAKPFAGEGGQGPEHLCDGSDDWRKDPFRSYLMSRRVYIASHTNLV
ncbi:PNN-interacting serine/arginine-rich protein [Trema orientale]|uniref:PNN-interacting serine/arginine-rich protein n=1 Tax=Trema orientale TaxID=63057 RepID=A0A2P5FMS2_TREOI|nr:PNN-interacting serine/arginine-rich protein [Trema orientale]